MSNSQCYGDQGHIKGGHWIPYRDDIMPFDGQRGMDVCFNLARCPGLFSNTFHWTSPPCLGSRLCFSWPRAWKATASRPWRHPKPKRMSLAISPGKVTRPCEVRPSRLSPLFPPVSSSQSAPSPHWPSTSSALNSLPQAVSSWTLSGHGHGRRYSG